MALFGRSFRRFWLLAGAVAVAALFAGASIVATTAPAQAQTHFRGHGFVRGHVGPGFYGRGWYGRGWYGRGFYGWPGYAAYWPYWPYAYSYYYPQYYYPQYVMPTAAYVMPPPAPHAVAPRMREFTVYFDFDRFNLTEDGRHVVEAAIAAIQAGGPAHIDVVGNTDLAGTNSYNFELSRHRADTVRNYLVMHGIDINEISVRAQGKTDPAVPTADGVREPRNRRVEIIITPRHHRQPPPMSMGQPSAMPANATMAPPPPSGVGAPTNLVGQ